MILYYMHVLVYGCRYAGVLNVQAKSLQTYASVLFSDFPEPFATHVRVNSDH